MDNRKLYLDAETEFWCFIDDGLTVKMAIEEVCLKYPRLDRMTLADYLYAAYSNEEE